MYMSMYMYSVTFGAAYRVPFAKVIHGVDIFYANGMGGACLLNSTHYNYTHAGQDDFAGDTTTKCQALCERGHGSLRGVDSGPERCPRLNLLLYQGGCGAVAPDSSEK